MTTPAAPLSVDVTTYEIFGMDPASVAAYLASMTVDLTVGQLDKVLIERTTPQWIVPGVEGPTTRPALTVVVAGIRLSRAYWDQPYDETATGEGAPPVCQSFDGITGHGTPGGVCRTCPMNQFGSDKGGTGPGKACRQYADVLILEAGDLFPKLVRIPRTSVGNVAHFVRTLAQRTIQDGATKRPMQVMDILVRLSLVKAKGYPQVQLQAVQLLTPDQRGLVAYYAAALTPLFEARSEPVEDGAASPSAEPDGTEDFPF